MLDVFEKCMKLCEFQQSLIRIAKGVLGGKTRALGKAGELLQQSN